MYQLIAKLSMLPAFNIVERKILLQIIEQLTRRISSLEERIEQLEVGKDKLEIILNKD